ncbi:unnamed protein product [Polarella glacialis]|uniref:Protein xylosyltransferase n=1 Tax=Polarella glacialis TaxID=89957 RepID=A0A813EFW3_POLGL|nr:unnamed protein product [Polarella glacialis]
MRDACSLRRRSLVLFSILAALPCSGKAVSSCAQNLDFLDCRSSEAAGPFDSSWETLLRESISHRGRGLVAPQSGKSDWWLEMSDLTSELAGMWLPIWVERHRVWDQVAKGERSAADLEGFCLLGLCTAFFLRAQYAADVEKLAEEALVELQYAQRILGEQLHRDVAKEFTSWPFDAADILLNANRLSKWIGSGRPGDDGPPRFVLADWSRGQPPAVSRPLPPWTGPCRPRQQQQQAEMALTVVAFGVHSSLVLEPATMLRAALFPRKINVRIYMRDCPEGNHQWGYHCHLQCQTLGDCQNVPEGSSRLFVDLIRHIEAVILTRETGLNNLAVATYLEILVQMHATDPQMREAALYVCTSPIICSLLRTAFETPLLAYLGMQLHVDINRQLDQLWLMHFKEMVRSPCSNVFAVHNFMMREQIHYATGVRLAVVRPRALYAQVDVPVWRQAKGGDPRRLLSGTQSWEKKVLIFRSSLFNASLTPFLLEAHATKCEFQLSLKIVRGSADFVSYRDLQRYRAVVLFPWDAALMSFWELYSLGGPALLLPDREWVYKVQQKTGWTSTMQLGEVELAGLKDLKGLGAASGRPDFAWSPWWAQGKASSEQVLYWYALSDYERLPHVVTFRSLSDMLLKLLDTTALRRSRAGLRRESRKALKRGLRWYREAAGWLMTGHAASDCCPG